jgi:broad specificity phosphatase PhoE
MRRMVLLRHGRSLANEKGLIVSRLEHAGEAYGLTPQGYEQVVRSVEQAQAEGSLPPPVVVVSSPLLRARESAEVAARLLGTQVSVDSRLTERDFGELELGADTLYEKVWAADAGDPTHRRWGVESLVDVLRRGGAVVAQMNTAVPDATVVLCTHGDVASTLLCASKGASLGLHRRVGTLETGALEHILAVGPILEALRAIDRPRKARPGG